MFEFIKKKGNDLFHAVTDQIEAPQVKRLKQVYPLLIGSLLWTAIIAIATVSAGIFLTSTQFWLLFFIQIGCTVSFHSDKSNPDQSWSIFVLALLTGTFGLMIGSTFTAMFATLANALTIILLASGLTIGATVASSLYGMLTDSIGRHFRLLESILFTTLTTASIAGLIMLFHPVPFVSLVWSTFSALLFASYIAFDTYKMIHYYGNSFNPFIATLDLYLDIINFFTDMLALLTEWFGGEKNGSNLNNLNINHSTSEHGGGILAFLGTVLMLSALPLMLLVGWIKWNDKSNQQTTTTTAHPDPDALNRPPAPENVTTLASKPPVVASEPNDNVVVDALQKPPSRCTIC